MKTFIVGDVHGRCAQLLNLLDMLPRDPQLDTLVFLGDLIDRGADAPGCVEHVLKLCSENRERVICLRGNHEQMCMDFLEGQATIWLEPIVGGQRTYEQYTGKSPYADPEQDPEEVRVTLERALPDEHLEFMQSLPFYHEDEHAIYVHAGLDAGKHPSESSPMSLMWMRDMDFYKNYRGKPCIFGHTPTPLLPLRGRLGRHGIYISNSAVGLDTGCERQSPLSCLSLPDFNLYQTFSDGREETHQITSFIPDALKEMQRRAGLY
ncbi:MAG TPA: metallophosphoesterase family protein [Pyrinomonadaceae bacterium]|nr:metallophosphoesterase family protein [Pyrinomonadaceae bacterium]